MHMTENHMVRCVKKSGDVVTQVGGTNSAGKSWSMSDRDVVAGIKSGRLKFYISSGAWIVVQQKNGRDVIEVDGDPAALGGLPECP
jgi:hypothetical protein